MEKNIQLTEKELTILYEAILYYLEEAEIPTEFSETEIDDLLNRILKILVLTKYTY
jgi:hypothetical protein